MKIGIRNALLGAVLGALAGLAVYHTQPAHLEMMNFFGVAAFASLGTSFGCLLSDDGLNRRRPW
ncbi:MAG: hypothetical protein WD403_13950 [Pirellulales bacterium]